MNITRTPPKVIPPDNLEYDLPDGVNDLSVNDEMDRISQIQALLHNFPEGNSRPTAKSNSSAVTDIMSALSILTAEVSGLRGDITASRDEVRTLSTTFGSTVARVDGLESAVHETNARVDSVEGRVTRLEAHDDTDLPRAVSESRLDDLEQAALQTKLILSLTTAQPTNTGTPKMQTSAIKDILTETLGILPAQMDAMGAYRIDTAGKRFVLDPVNCDLRAILYNKCKVIKPTTLYVNDYLTKRRHNLIYNIRQLKDSNPSLTKVFSNRGAVFVVIMDANQESQGPKKVSSMEDVTRLLAQADSADTR